MIRTGPTEHLMCYNLVCMKSVARSRFEQYADAVFKVHGVRDDIGLAVLAATQSIDTGIRKSLGPPIILETDYFSVIHAQAMSAVWFDMWGMGGLCVGSFGAYSLPFARRTRPRYDNGIVDGLLSKIQSKEFPFVLVEPEYTEPRNRPHQYSELYPILLDSCIRLRVPMPRVGSPSMLDEQVMDDSKRRLLENEIRDSHSHPNATKSNLLLSSQSFLHRLEQSFLASGKLRDWGLLNVNLSKLDASLRWLFNEPNLDTTPYLERVAQDIVPTYAYRMLSAGCNGFKTWTFNGGGGLSSPWRLEMKRLKDEGFLAFNKTRSEWKTTELGDKVLQFSNDA